MRLLLLFVIACGSSSERPPVAPPPPPSVVVDAADAADAAPVVDAAVVDAAPAKAATLELAFVGDLMFGGYFDDHYDPQFVEKHDPLVDVTPLLAGDLVFGNFETTITRKLPNNGGPHDGPGNKRFVTIPERAAVLAKRFHAVTLANNHMLDNGEAGVVETPKILGELGIKFVGAVREAPLFRVETLEVKGWKLGFVAATAVLNRSPGKTGPRPPFADESKIKQELLPVIAAARTGHDLVIVQLHWGYEYQDAPARWQIDAAHAFVDAGADAVIGHHPHVLQGIERYKGGVIAYSLGNFVFPNAKERIRDTGVLHLTYTGSCLSAIAFDPAFQIRQPITHPIRPNANQRAEVGKRLAELSKPFKTAWDVSGERFTAPAACR